MVALPDGMSIASSAPPRVAFEERGVGPTLLFVHNAGTDRHLWGPVVDRLASRFRCVSLDLPGFGASPPVEEPTLRAHADAVAWVVGRVGGVDALVGHCVGGAACWDLARRRPELVPRLVLSAPATLATMQAGPYGVLQRNLPGHPRRDRLALAAARAVLGFSATRWAVVRSQTRVRGGARSHLDHCHARPDHLDSLHRLLHHFDSFGVLDEPEAAVSMPTMLLWGSRNRVLPVSRMAAVAWGLRPAEQHVLPAGHLAMLDEPDAFAERVEGFLSSPHRPR